MRDGLVNWSKLRQIGRHCAIVSNCGGLALSFTQSENISRLVAALPVYSIDEDVSGERNVFPIIEIHMGITDTL